MKKSYAVEPRSIGKTSQRYGSMFAQKVASMFFVKNVSYAIALEKSL